MLAATSRTPQKFGLVTVELQMVGMHPDSNGAETLVDVQYECVNVN